MAGIERLTITLATDMVAVVKRGEAIETSFLAAIETVFEPLRYFSLARPAHDNLDPGPRVTFRSP